MDKYIVVNVSMFAAENQVMIYSEEDGMEMIGSYSIQDLPSIISTMAHESGINKVKLIGGSKYAQLIEFGIESAEKAKYDKNTIEIEVM